MPKSLFLPGAAGSATFWQPVAHQIDFPQKPHHFSWPGLGHEPHDDTVDSVDHLVSIVTRQMERRCNVIAQSMGGLIAVKAALARPEKVNALVLVATSAGLPMDQHGASDWARSYFEEYPNAKRWIGDANEDLTEQLSSLDIPTLLIWGDTDPISPVSVGTTLRSLIPNAELYVVKGGDHDLALTHADTIAPLIARHINVSMRHEYNRQPR